MVYYPGGWGSLFLIHVGFLKSYLANKIIFDDVHCRRLMRGVKEQIKVNRAEEKRRQMEEKRHTDEHKRIMNLPAITETKKVMTDTPRSATSMSQPRPSSASSMSTVMTNLPGSLKSYDPQFVSSKTSVLSKASSRGSILSRTSSKASLPRINMTAALGQQGR